MSYTRDVVNDLIYDEDSGEYEPIPVPSNPIVKELEANDTVYDIIGKGIVNKNSSTPLKMWSGTQEEYDAIVTKDASTIYNITDGASESIATTSGNNTFTGTNNFVTPSLNDNTTKVATTAWVNAVVNNKMSLTLLDYKWTDHILNNVSWLRSDTFSWQDGSVYEASYEHLEDEFTIAQAEQGRLVDDKIIPTYYDTIGSYTIYYWLAEDGHKIVTDLDDEQTLIDIYNESGSAWYYLLDTGNERFKLPRSSHGDIVEKYQNGTEWYRVYSDGWCEQGGYKTFSSSSETVIFSKPFKDNYYSLSTCVRAGDAYPKTLNITAYDATSFTGKATTDGGGSISTIYWWKACGYLNSYAPNTQYKYLYFYVGQYSQSATEQTAGINSELFNSKADVDLSNINASTAAKETIVGWGMPDLSAQYTTTTLPYTLPVNSYVIAYGQISNWQAKMIDSNNKIIAWWSASSTSSYAGSGTVEVEKGTTISIDGCASGTVTLHITPMKGTL